MLFSIFSLQLLIPYNWYYCSFDFCIQSFLVNIQNSLVTLKFIFIHIVFYLLTNLAKNSKQRDREVNLSYLVVPTNLLTRKIMEIINTDSVKYSRSLNLSLWKSWWYSPSLSLPSKRFCI